MAKLSNQFSAAGLKQRTTAFRPHRRDTFPGEPKFSEGRTTIRLAGCGAKNWIPCKTYELALILTASQGAAGGVWWVVALDASNYVYGPLNALPGTDMCAYTPGRAIILPWLTLWRSFDGHKSQLVFHLNGS